jgi:hypothetical protein
MKTWTKDAIIATEKMSYHMVSHWPWVGVIATVTHHSERFKAALPCRILHLQSPSTRDNLSTDKMLIRLNPNRPARTENDEGAQEIQRRVDQRGREGDRARVQDRDCFGCDQQDIHDGIH